MIKIVIIGAGNVAQHLLSAFFESKIVVVKQIFSRTPKTILNVKTIRINNFETIENADLYIISVSDDAIEAILTQLPFKNRLVVTTSAVFDPKGVAQNNRIGTFYPLQSFSKNKEIDFSSIPICIEAQDQEDIDLLQTVAQTISKTVCKLTLLQRKNLHLAAVFANNFVNLMYQISHDICQSNQLPFALLQPLILETAQKVAQISPQAAQTGPAKRQDMSTIEAHQKLIDDPTYQKIYALLTQTIIANANKL